jgi:hypothetical protein
MPFDFNAWIRQPSTIHGLAVAAAGVGAALSHFATGNQTVDAIIAVIAYVGLHLGVDDHSVAETAVTNLTGDVLRFAPGAPPLTAEDVRKIAADAFVALTATSTSTAPAAAPPPAAN